MTIACSADVDFSELSNSTRLREVYDAAVQCVAFVLGVPRAPRQAKSLRSSACEVLPRNPVLVAGLELMSSASCKG
jgi:hypothetical protein